MPVHVLFVMVTMGDAPKHLMPDASGSLFANAVDDFSRVLLRDFQKTPGEIFSLSLALIGESGFLWGGLRASGSSCL